MGHTMVSSTLLWNASLEEMFDQVCRCGLDGIELWAQHFFAKGYSEKQYLRLSALYPLRTYVHSCSWDLNLCSMNEGIRKASVDQVIVSMELASRLGVFEVTVHPGHMTLGNDMGMYIRWMRESLEEIARASRRLGIDLSLEIMEKAKGEFAVNGQAMKVITGDLFDSFYYTLDVAHCDSMEEACSIMASMERVSKIHISNREGSRLHTPLAEGDFNLGAILPDLYGYGIPVVVEGYDGSRDFNILKKNAEFLKTNGGL